MKQQAIGIILLFLVSTLPVGMSQTSNDQTSTESYSITGSVYDTDGSIAGATSIKLSGYESIWSDTAGTYQFTEIPAGEYSIRAYFMENGHIAVYRKIVLDSDLTLDWVVGNNWITIESSDTSASFTVTTDAGSETKSAAGLVEFGPYQTGQFIEIESHFSDGTHSNTIAKLHRGSSTEPFLNHYSLDSDKTCKYGYVSDSLGNPIEAVKVTIGDHHRNTDVDGFYSMCGLTIGESVDVSVSSGDVILVATHPHELTNGDGWHNFTSEIIPEVPGQPDFITQSFDTPIDQYTHNIEWTTGDYTDYVELYIDGDLAYRGYNSNYSFTPTNTGTYEFELLALNANGTTEAGKKITVVVLGNSGSGFWNVGMNWQYAVDYYPVSSAGTHNVTMTVVGTEYQVDAFGTDQECYLMKVTDEYDTPDRVRYYWIDTDNLLKIRTYSETSSYFVDGTMGWQYTDSDGAQTNLFSDTVSSVHFNRTNIIGVPGHPNGYDDTNNTVTVNENVLVSTPNNDYLTTQYIITDNGDGIDSWELYYNETVRNWVKIVDRLPGSHSESVTYHLIDYSGIPLKPQFVTENNTVPTKHYTIDWGSFGSAQHYDLFEDGELVYSGTETSYLAENKDDGSYDYQVVVTLFSGTEISSEPVTVSVNYVVPVPELDLPYAQNVTENDGLYISWSKTVEADWYSLHYTSPEGVTNEVYNGTNNFFTFTGLEEGQNRFRANLGFDGGKYSELSNSSYVNYIPEVDEESNGVNFISFVSVIAIILLALVVRSRDGDLVD